MKMIVAVNNNWGIGKDNDLLYHISQDMKFFREKTKGNIIIVGRKTLESFPDSKPLKFRTNVVLTRDKDYSQDDCIILHNLTDLFGYLKSTKDEVYVCGGEEIYKLLEPYCDVAYVTKINDNKDATKFFPDLDKLSNWEITSESDEYNEDNYSFKFVEYKNNNIKERV